MAGLGISRYKKKPHSPFALKSEVQGTVNYPEEERQDPSGGVVNVVHRVTFWNNNPDKLQYKERLTSLWKIKQNVAQVSMNPQEWPTLYLSQPALLRFLRLVVENCIQHSSSEYISTAEMRVAVKRIVEPIDVHTVKDMPFRRHISKWVYGTEKLPLFMDCENMLSLHKYFQYALDHMCGGLRKGDTLGVIQPDISTRVTTSLANVVFCFTNHLKMVGQKYEETFIITMLLPFKYDPDEHAFLASISAHDIKYLCNKFEHHCREFFEVIKQHNLKKMQEHLVLLALKMYTDLNIPNFLIKSCLKWIEQRFGKDIDPQITKLLPHLQSYNYDWTWFQSQMKSVGSPEEERKRLPLSTSTKQQCEEFFSVLGLTDFYPQKLTLQCALQIREDTLECVKHLQHTSNSAAHKKQIKKAPKPAPCTDPRLYPFLILQKIMAFDYTCRSKLVLSSTSHSDSVNILTMRTGVETSVSKLVIHPMDGLLAVLHCADNFLRQYLMSRLATCQLAVPLLLPDPFEPHKVTFPIWALRSIVKEWQLPNETSKEGPLISSPSPLVSFLRIGKLKMSKSQLMNTIISESKHDIFFHYSCDGGHDRQLLVKGLVEMCWYLPSKWNQLFSNPIAFANLHGDARECPKQVKFLSKVSFINFVFISKNHLNDEGLTALKNLAMSPGGLIILQVDASHDDNVLHEWVQPIQQPVQIISLLHKNEANICELVHEKINMKVSEKWNDVAKYSSLDKQGDVAHSCDIFVDEDEEHCQVGKKLASGFERIMNDFRKTHRNESLRQSLPLQGPDFWQKWAMTEKEQYRQTMRDKCEVEVYYQQQKKDMEGIRKKQVNQAQNLQPLMKSFLTSLLTHQGKTRLYFLQWIQLLLDNLANEQLPPLYTQYEHKVSDLHFIQSTYDEAAKHACKAELHKLDKQINDASFGLEHLLREMGQIYEATATQLKAPQNDLHFLCLPEVAAEVMIEGFPLELMDRDAVHVPISWVTAVLSKVQELLNNPKVFVVSVLGVQSSGKSTLLNTVFGTRFNTSAGRCSCGTFMQLLPVHSSLRQGCNCDYFLIVDTEGLRASELAEQTQKHDNEVATFVIGLSHLTIINLSGETMGDMDDILQTTVHAFLRMKTVELKPSCHFVHQNVTAVTAGEKAMMRHGKFKEAFDMKTQAAAKAEGLEDRYRHFTDVINFDSEKHVFHFQHLWRGDPPMAPVNPGYSTNAQLLKLCVITHAKQVHSTDLKVFERSLKDLWKAIICENVVFAFKNTLELTAYKTLCGAYSNWSWKFKEDMMTWERKVHNMMKSCQMSQLQSIDYKCCSELPYYVQIIHQRLQEEMDAYFENSPHLEIIIKWKPNTEMMLNTLRRQLQQQAEHHCRFWKMSQEVFAKVENMKVIYCDLILQYVKHLVSQPRKVKLNHKQLEESFNEKWVEWVNEIKYLSVQREEVNVEGDVEKCLTEFGLLTTSSSMVLEKLLMSPLKRRGLDLQLEVKNAHIKSSPEYLGSWKSTVLVGGQHITNELLQQQKLYVQQMEMQCYSPNLATDLLNRLFNGIAVHSMKVTFTEEYRVDMALTVCGYAVRKFKKMVENERKYNDPVENMERNVRGPLLKLFKDEYYKMY